MPATIRTLTVAITTVLFIFICLFTFFKLFGPIPFFIQNVTTTKETLFTVQGTGEASAIPDTAIISLGVTKTASTVESAKNQVNSIANQITADLKKLNVDSKDIKTTDYSVYPQYDYKNGSQRITGYTVSSNIQVKLQPIDKANDAIDIATADGATNVGGVQFKLNEDKQKELENQAREKAIANAKEKAQALANSAGIRLGRIVDVQESPQNYPITYRDSSLMSAEKAGGEPTELSPGENKISTTITLSFETY